MSTKQINVGIIGAGANTRSKHIPGLQAIDGVEIVAVCNRSRESGERVAKEFGIPHVYEDWMALINAPEVDAVMIGTWPYMHCRLTLATLAADKHVMCEARMAMNATEAHRMREAARMKPHLITQIVPSPFTLRVDKTVKRLLSEGYIGDLLAVEVRAGGGFLDKDGEMHWRHNFDLSGLNIMSKGIWYEALLRWVGGATQVAALGKTYVNMRKDSDGTLKPTRIPEHLDIIGDLACGAQLHMQISSVAGLVPGPEAYLFGSEGTIRFADNTLYGGQRGDDSLSELEIPENEAGGWRVEEEFISAIRGQEEITHTSFEDGVKYMEFTEAVTRSMQSGCAVPLPLL